MIRLHRLLLLVTAGIVMSLHAGVLRAEENSQEQSMPFILSHAYMHNPSLLAARYELYAVHESLPQAQAGFKPTISVDGNISNVEIDGSNFGGRGTTSKEYQVGFNQPLFRGGRTYSNTKSSRDKIRAQRAILEAAEQNLMLAASSAYMDVMRDEALLKLSISNEELLKEELIATENRFDVGQLTITDVSQAKARLAKAEAERISAHGQLMTSKAVFEQITGLKPYKLSPPSLDLQIPASLEEAIRLSRVTNLELKAARFLHDSADHDIGSVFGELLPEVGLFGSWNRVYDPQPGLLEESTTKTIGVQASVPLYNAGLSRSKVRQAKYTKNKLFMEALNIEKAVKSQTVSDWERLAAARAEIESRKAQVEATKIAMEGVKKEAELGSRTILDTLDADQEYLDAQVSLVIAKRNEIVASFSLAYTLGLLTPENLGYAGLSEKYEQQLLNSQSKIFSMNVDID